MGTNGEEEGIGFKKVNISDIFRKHNSLCQQSLWVFCYLTPKKFPRGLLEENFICITESVDNVRGMFKMTFSRLRVIYLKTKNLDPMHSYF